MKPTIAIIGTGTRGNELAISLSDAPYRLLLFDRQLSRALALVNRMIRFNPSADVEAIDCPTNASWEADIIVMAVPDDSLQELANRIRDVATGKIVITLSLSKTTNGFSKPADPNPGENVQTWLPNSKVVNVIRLITDEKPDDAFVSGTDQNALNTVSSLLQTAGLKPVFDLNLSAHSTLASLQISKPV